MSESKTDTLLRVLHGGGSWLSNVPSWVRAASRSTDVPADRGFILGFRTHLPVRQPRVVPIGWDETAWERFCLYRYGAADDVRAMKPEDILTER